ncbi:MAG: fibronectin type III domain-containing protein [Flavobacteriales bacterium]
MKYAYYIVKLGLDKITSPGLLVKARNMVASLQTNLLFPLPVPPLVEVTAAADQLETAINAFDLNPGPGERIDRTLAFDALKANVVELGGYVQAASNGDLDAIKSAGCSVRRNPVPRGPLPAPGNLVVRTSAYPRMLDVQWGGVTGRSMYELEVCKGDPTLAANWSVLVVTSKNRYTAEGLESDSTYFFRVRAFGAAGYSPMSDTAQAKAA